MVGPVRVTAKRLREFKAKLEMLGGSAGNIRLRRELGWEEGFYWEVQGRLIKDGDITAGRGLGGSVSLTAAEAEEAEPVAPFVANSERELYEPLKASIKTKWINRFGFDSVEVEETHSRGAKDTGGTFTRPDITAAGIRRYVYLPKRLEIVTFEVKPATNVGVMGVLEAIAHREAAHRSYVLYHCDREAFDGCAEANRILELAQKYGIGVILARDPREVEGWEIVLDAARHEPDPARLDRFLGDLPNEEMKQQLSKWKE